MSSMMEKRFKSISNDHDDDEDFETCKNIRKIATGKGDDNTTGCLLGYPYFEEDYKMIAKDLIKQHKLLMLTLEQFSKLILL